MVAGTAVSASWTRRTMSAHTTKVPLQYQATPSLKISSITTAPGLKHGSELVAVDVLDHRVPDQISDLVEGHPVVRQQGHKAVPQFPMRPLLPRALWHGPATPSEASQCNLARL